MAQSRVMLLGSGSLAAATAFGLAGLAGGKPVDVRLLARNERACRRICHVARGVGDSPGARGVAFSYASVPVLDRPTLARAFAAHAPDVVLVMASAFSPAEKVLGPNGWAGLLGRAPFGLTLPLQSVVALAAAEALADAGVPAVLVNGCYPDAVNPLLHALGHRPLAGVGNISSLADGVRRVVPSGTVRAIGHHWHLDQPMKPADEVRVWLDGEPYPQAAEVLREHRRLPRRSLNALAGGCASALVGAWIDGREWADSLPGPLGLAGGYPVRLSDRELSLDLPAGIDRDAAVQCNRAYAERDGVVVDRTVATYSGRAREQLERVGYPYAEGFALTALRDAAAAMADLRTRLLADQPTHPEARCA
jgi:hypothetical protein